jgi:methionine sulfoxide reductase heme-binding subunit
MVGRRIRSGSLIGMLALSSSWIWYSTRASGIVALVLLTVTTVVGILTTTRSGSAWLPRFAVGELHRRASLLAMVFVALHVVTAVVDTYVPIGLAAAFVPFISGYEPFWVGLGAVAFDLLLAVMITSALRGRISAGSWRAVHWLAYASWPIAVAHCIGVGTDLVSIWMDVLVGVCIASVLAAVAWRIHRQPHQGGALTAVPRVAAPHSSIPQGSRP